MDEKKIIRIKSLTLRDFKNVSYGTFTMPSFLKKKSESADILGIYGQNGSGKTAVIEAFEVIDALFSGDALPLDAPNYINVDKDRAEITISFSISDDPDEKGSEYTYTVTFARLKKEAAIEDETLTVKLLKADGSFERERTLLEVDRTSERLFPDSTVKKIVKNDRALELDLAVAMRMSKKSNTSFFFSKDGGFDPLTGLKGDYAESHAEPIKAIRNYALSSLTVFSLKDSAPASDTLILTYGKTGERGRLSIDLKKPALVTMKERDMLERLIREMNTVLGAIVPHLELGLVSTSEELDESGEKGIRIELVSLKNGKAIPLRYESEGIIKIIGIINALLCVYNSPSMCLVIDEFDASIFEYLLGEIISVFSKGAEGQMIFTSHNLRVLEMIDKDSVIFSTANPENRYIRFTNIKNTNNLRDVYIRSILLGGTEEDIYEDTDAEDIGRALRRAWRSDGER